MKELKLKSGGIEEDKNQLEDKHVCGKAGVTEHAIPNSVCYQSIDFT